MYNSRYINREERNEDANWVALFIKKALNEYEFSDEPQPMSAWKNLICSYFTNSFHLSPNFDKRYDEKYHRSIFDILLKDYEYFETFSNHKGVKTYQWIYDDLVVIHDEDADIPQNNTSESD